jgi:hypothetical protein
MPSRRESKATWVKKKNCPSLSVRAGRVRRSKIKDVMPKRNVKPGWLLQQEGRAHQMRMQRMSVTVMVALSRFLKEVASVGKRK